MIRASYIRKEQAKIMIESDTIKLLRECDAGVKMGTKSINDVLEYTASQELR